MSIKSMLSYVKGKAHVATCKVKLAATIAKDNAVPAAKYIAVPKTRLNQVGCVVSAAAATTAVVTGISTAPVMVPVAIVGHALWCVLDNPTPEWDMSAVSIAALKEATPQQQAQVLAMLRPGGTVPQTKDRSVCDTCDSADQGICDTCEVSD